nr:MAG TPA: hypothetical protein [Caudoviricetes sp.]
MSIQFKKLKHPYISTHAPTQGATKKSPRMVYYHLFQLTHPCGVRPFPHVQMLYLASFQLTHPCGVRLSSKFADVAFSSISTHTPVWGATTLSGQIIKN